MRVLVCRTWLVALLTFGVSLPGLADDDDSFETRLRYLREQRAQEVGRDPIVAGYEQLIADFPADPRVVEAMMDVGIVMEWTISELQIEPDHVASLHWYRKAAAAAEPGSKLWTKAQFKVAHRQLEDAEARRIFKEIAKHADGDSLTLATVEHDLMQLCVHEGDLEAAKEHCERVLHWYDDRARVPTDSFEKMMLDSWIRSAARTMVTAWKGGASPKEARAERIRTFMEDYDWVGGLQNAGDEALDYIERQPDPRPGPPAPNPGAARWHRLLIIVNIAVLAILAVVWYVRSKRRKRQGDD